MRTTWYSAWKMLYRLSCASVSCRSHSTCFMETCTTKDHESTFESVTFDRSLLLRGRYKKFGTFWKLVLQLFVCFRSGDRKFRILLTPLKTTVTRLLFIVRCFSRFPKSEWPPRGRLELGTQASDLGSRNMFRFTEVQVTVASERVWAQNGTAAISVLPRYWWQNS